MNLFVKNKFRLILTTVMIPLTFSCQNIKANDKNDAAAVTAKINSEISKLHDEKLYKIELGKKTLSFNVISTGCTQAKNFSLSTDLIAPQQYELTVIRLKDDNCRAMPHLKTITIDLPLFLQDKGTLIKLNNPLAYYPAIVRK